MIYFNHSEQEKETNLVSVQCVMNRVKPLPTIGKKIKTDDKRRKQEQRRQKCSIRTQSKQQSKYIRQSLIQHEFQAPIREALSHYVLKSYPFIKKNAIKSGIKTSRSYSTIRTKTINNLKHFIQLEPGKTTCYTLHEDKGKIQQRVIILTL